MQVLGSSATCNRTNSNFGLCMVRLAAPQWLLLLPAFAALSWRLPRMQLWQPLRAVCVVLVVLYLSRPEIAHGLRTRSVGAGRSFRLGARDR